MKNSFLFFALTIVSIGHAQQLKEQPLPLDQKVKRGVLPNGLTYYIRRNTEPKNRAELYLVNKVGSLQEKDNQQGLAHFAEHMAFNGTKDFPKNSLVDYLQTAGVRFGADLNAYTSFDQTVYQLPIPTDDEALFNKGFDILLNWAGYVSFDGVEINNERGVVLEEERLRGKNMQDRISKQVDPVLMANSKFVERMPIGKTEILKTFNHQLIRQYYADWYRPDLQAVIAVGDFNVEEVEKAIISKFSVLKNPAKERKLVEYNIPGNKTPLIKIATDPEFRYAVVSIYYKHKHEVIKTVPQYRRALIHGMINMMMSDRLEEIRQQANPPFLGASAAYGQFLGNQDAYAINVQTKDAAMLERGVKAAVVESERMSRYGFIIGELERAKQNLLAGIESAYNERNKVSSGFYVHEYQKNFLTGEASPGIEKEYQLYQEILTTVTLNEVNEIAAGFVTPENQVLIIEANDKEKAALPDEKTFQSWMKVDSKLVTPYIEGNASGVLMEMIPKAGKIVSEQVKVPLKVLELTLSNGAKVILKPTGFKDDEVVFGAISKGGLSLADERKYRAAQYSPYLVSASGVATLSSLQLNKLLAGKSLSVTPYINQYEEGINGAVVLKDLETALKLTYLYFTSPRKDTTVMNTIKDELATSINTRYTNPVAAYQDTIGMLMNNRNYRSKPLNEVELKNLKLDDALSFYKDRFSDASDFTFFFIGSFDVDKIKPLVETYIASLPSNNQKETFKDVGLKPVDGKISRTVYRGLEDKANVTLTYHGAYAYSNGTNLELDAVKSVLQNKLTERLREKEAGVYSPGVSVREDMIPAAQFRVQVTFSCAPANVEKLIAAVEDEVLLMKNGIDNENLNKFKVEEKRQLELRLRENNFWFNYLKAVNRGEKTEDYLLNYNSKLAALTSDQVKDAAKRFLNPENMVRVVLLPEASPRPSPEQRGK